MNGHNTAKRQFIRTTFDEENMNVLKFLEHNKFGNILTKSCKNLENPACTLTGSMKIYPFQVD